MKVICAKCSASYDIENQRIPAEGMTMKCPKCLGSFQVQRPEAEGQAPAAPSDAGDDTKYFIRRHTGSVFGPFAQSAILTMATDGKLDGSEDLSPDKVDWTRIADHAAFATIFGAPSMEDLPAPAPQQPPTSGVPRPDPIPGAAQPHADLPAPVADQATKMGMPGITPPVPPRPAITPPAPAKPAITPPAPDMPDLPAPKATGAATGGPAVPPRPAITPPAPAKPAITPPAPDMPDLPAPKAAGAAPGGPAVPPRPAITPPAPAKPAITPPAPDMPDLPAPKAAGAAPGGPAVPPRPAITPPAPAKPSITPPAPDMPDLPAPKTAGAAPAAPPRPAITPPAPVNVPIAPPAPEMPDLPTPLVTPGASAQPDLPTPKAPGSAPLSAARTTPKAPELPDLPTPKKPGAPAVGLDGLPDLPAPKGAQASGSGFGAAPSLAPEQAELPAPKGAPSPDGSPAQPDLPTPIGAPPAAGGPAQPDLPTPKGAPPVAGAPEQPDLPTPLGGAPGEEPGMSYGEVDLPVPTEGDNSGAGGEAPLDLSELDLVTPKLSDDAIGAGAAPDLSELDLVAPKADPTAAAPAAAPDTGEALGDVADLLETEAAPRKAAPRKKSPPRAATPAGARLLGLPKMVAIGAIVVLVLGGIGAGAFVYVSQSKKGSGGKSTTKANSNQNTGPVKPTPTGKTKVAYAPAMDLDTHQGYLTADKTYRKQYKKNPSSSLKAARAKARLCDAYRFGVKGKRLATANKFLAAGEADDVEQRKAKALWYLLRKKPKKARGQLKKARAKAKKDPEIYLFLGWAELDAGRAERAEKAFRRAIKYRGESAAALFGLALSLSDSGDPARAAERRTLLAKVVKLSPRHVQARVAALAAGPASKAVAGIKSLSTLSETLGENAAPLERANLAFGLGHLHHRTGQLDKALTLLAKASKLAPKQWSILGAEGEALLEAGDGEQATKQLKIALGLRPHNSRLLEALVRAHIARGQPLAAKDAILDFKGVQPAVKKAPKKKRKKKARKKRRRRRKKKRPKTDDATTPAKLPKPTGPSSPHLALARGRVALALGKTAEAKNHFLESTAEAPRFTAGHVAYLQLMLQAGRLEGMKSVLELIKRKYSNGLPAALRDMEGQLLLSRSKPARAEKAFRAALETEPESNRILIHLALCLWKHQKKPEEAYLLLQKIYKRAKSMTEVVSLLADYHWSAGDKDRSFARFKSALKVNRSLTLRRRYAEFLLRAPNPVRLARAEKLLAPILKADSLDHAATALFALVELGKGQNKKAMTRITRALTRSKKNVSYLVIKARIAEASGRAKEALNIYEGLLDKQPKNRQITLLRARLLCRNRITKRCLKAARKILKRFGDAEGHVLMGQAYLQKRKPGRAMRSFKKAITQKKHYAEAHFLLGRTQYHDAMFRKALASLIRCLELAEETTRWWPDTHYFLGMAYFKVRNKRMAKKHLSKYVSTKGNPDNVETSEQQRSAKSTLRKL